MRGYYIWLLFVQVANAFNASDPCDKSKIDVVLNDCPLKQVYLGDGDQMELDFGVYDWEIPWVNRGNESVDGYWIMSGKGYGWSKNGESHRMDSPGPIIKLAKGSKTFVLNRNLLNVTAQQALDLNSNIHTHGLHVSSLEDDPAIKVPPGTEYLYEYNLPEDHAGGTHWYHPHMHRISELFINGGAAGMIIVEDKDDGTEIPLDVLEMEEVPLFIQYFNPSRLWQLSQGHPDSFSTRFNTRDPTFDVDMSMKGFSSISAGFSALKQEFYFVNGFYRPTLELQQGIWYRWRIAHVANDQDVKLVLRDAAAMGCTFKLLSRDGVYVPFGPRLLDFSSGNYIHLHPASRADILVMCDGAVGETGAIYDNFNSYYRDVSSTFSDFTGIYNGRLDIDKRERIINLKIVTATKPAGLGKEFDFVPCLPYYLVNLLDKPVAAFGNMTVTDRAAIQPFVRQVAPFYHDLYQEVIDSQDEASYWRDASNSTFTVEVTPFDFNGVPFKGWYIDVANDPAHRNITIMLMGEVTRWRLTSSSINHPLHIHVNHFQMESDVTEFLLPEEWSFTQRGDWVDTIRISPLREEVVFRFQPDTFTGKIPLHCHNNDHSDEGAVAQTFVMENPHLVDPLSPSMTRPWNGICGAQISIITPTSQPTTVAPSTASPTTRMPSFSPTTISPTTTSPTTVTPTSSPTSSPATSSPSSNPTQSPTSKPTTHSPTISPVVVPVPSFTPTSLPSASPTTSSPSVSPTTFAPSVSPSTLMPTQAPTSSPTTSSPSTFGPTTSPTDTDSPTASPSTSAPTSAPTIAALVVNILTGQGLIVSPSQGLLLRSTLVRASTGTTVHYCWLRVNGKLAFPLLNETDKTDCGVALPSVYGTPLNGPNLVIKPWQLSPGAYKYSLTATQGGRMASTTITFLVRSPPDLNMLALHVTPTIGVAGVTKFNISIDNPLDVGDHEYRFAVLRNTKKGGTISISDYVSSSKLDQVTLPFSDPELDISFVSIVAFVKDRFSAESEMLQAQNIRLDESTFADLVLNSVTNDRSAEDILREQLSAASILSKDAFEAYNQNDNVLITNVRNGRLLVLGFMDVALEKMFAKSYSFELGALGLLVLRELASESQVNDQQVTAGIVATSLGLLKQYRESLEETLLRAPYLSYLVSDTPIQVLLDIISSLISASSCVDDIDWLFEMTFNLELIGMVPSQESSSHESDAMSVIVLKVFENAKSIRATPPKGNSYISLPEGSLDPGEKLYYESIEMIVSRINMDLVCESVRRMLGTTDYNFVSEVLRLNLNHNSSVFNSSSRILVHHEFPTMSLDIPVNCGQRGNGEWTTLTCETIISTSSSITCSCWNVLPSTSFVAWNNITLSPSLSPTLSPTHIYLPPVDGTFIFVTFVPFILWLCLSFILQFQDLKDADNLERMAILGLVYNKNKKKPETRNKNRPLTIHEAGFGVKHARWLERLTIMKLQPHSKISRISPFSTHSIAGLFYYNPMISRVARSFLLPLQLSIGVASIDFLNSSLGWSDIYLIVPISAAVVCSMLFIAKVYFHLVSRFQLNQFSRVAFLKARISYAWPLEAEIGDSSISYLTTPEKQLEQHYMRTYLCEQKLMQLDQPHQKNGWMHNKNILWMFPTVYQKALSRYYGGNVPLTLEYDLQRKALHKFRKEYNLFNSFQMRFVGFIQISVVAIAIYFMFLKVSAISTQSDSFSTYYLGIASAVASMLILEPVFQILIMLIWRRRPTFKDYELVVARKSHFSWDLRLSTRTDDLDQLEDKSQFTKKSQRAFSVFSKSSRKSFSSKFFGRRDSKDGDFDESESRSLFSRKKNSRQVDRDVSDEDESALPNDEDFR